MEDYLLIKYFECKTTEDENRKIHSWLADDPDGSHKQQYLEARMMFNGTTLFSPATNLQVQHSSSAVNQRRFRKGLLWTLSSVAVAALVVLGTFLFTQNHFDTLYSQKMLVAHAAAGQTMQFTLEDGTVLFLNSGTTVRYPAVFPKKSRKVTLLDGEALFEVSPDAARPFVVETFASEVKALGTKFSVAADTTSGYFSTALLEGKIQVANKSDGEVCILTPGMIASISSGELTWSRSGNVEDALLWTEGQISISGILFPELMKKFEKSFGVTIRIQRNDIPEISYTRGKVRISDGVEHALDMLRLGADFDYEYHPDTKVVIIK